MNILVTGASGQLGSDCMSELSARGYSGVGIARKKKDNSEELVIDLCSEHDIRKILGDIDCVIHCAAWTDVDEAEKPENYKAVQSINVKATETIAKVCSSTNTKLIYISTDYVFDGHGTKAWSPDDRDFAPLSIYGKSKLDGEFAVRKYLDRFFIVRTSWMFGKNGDNFVKTMISKGSKAEYVRVVNDQIGSPTYSKDLARLLVDMVESDQYGIYHARNEGNYVSWYDFCEYFFALCGLKTKIIPISTKEYGFSLAKRPLNSRLDTTKLVKSGFKLLPTWQNAVRRYISSEFPKMNEVSEI